MDEFDLIEPIMQDYENDLIHRLIDGEYYLNSYNDIVTTIDIGGLEQEIIIAPRSTVVLLYVAAQYISQISDRMNILIPSGDYDIMNPFNWTIIAWSGNGSCDVLQYLLDLHLDYSDEYCISVNVQYIDDEHDFILGYNITDISHVTNKINTQEVIERVQGYDTHTVLRTNGSLMYNGVMYDNGVLDVGIIPSDVIDINDAIRMLVRDELKINSYGDVYDPLTYRIHIGREAVAILYVGLSRINASTVHIEDYRSYINITHRGDIEHSVAQKFLSMIDVNLKSGPSLQVTREDVMDDTEHKLYTQVSTLMNSCCGAAYTRSQDLFLYDSSIRLYRSGRYVRIGDVTLSPSIFDVLERYDYNIVRYGGLNNVKIIQGSAAVRSVDTTLLQDVSMLFND